MLEVRGLQKYFPIKGKGLVRRTVGYIKAVDGIDLTLFPGETLGLVGESGCGKSTTGRAILNLQPATDGSVKYNGRELVGLGRAAMRPLRREIQIVFQDPYASLNPRLPVLDIVAEPLIIHRSCRANQIREPGQRAARNWSASTPSTTTGTRTSSPAASGSASASPARSRWSPRC